MANRSVLVADVAEVGVAVVVLAEVVAVVAVVLVFFLRLGMLCVVTLLL
jgi:hypothetical protein